MPPSGYINVLDFKSPKDLAEYMLYLDKNTTAYNAFFKWKRHISFLQHTIEPIMAPICSMCIQLYLERFSLKGNIKKQVIEDAGHLWNKKLECNNFEVKTLQLTPWKCWVFECDNDDKENDQDNK